MDYFERDFINRQIELEKEKLSDYEEELSQLYREAQRIKNLIRIANGNIDNLKRKLGGENDWEKDSELQHNFQY